MSTRQMRDAAWAVEAYERARHRLPQAKAAGAAAPVSNVLEIAENYDAFLLDAFGVLNVGATAIPGATAAVSALQNMGKRVLVLTNGATYPADVALAKYRNWGFDFRLEDVVSSRDALSVRLSGMEGSRWGVMAVDGSRLNELSGSASLLADDAVDYAACEGFILLGSGTWTEDRQRLLIDALTRKPRPVLVGNPDIVAPREDGFSAEPGHFAHELADLTGVVPEFFGKPFGNIYELARSRLAEIPAGRILAVGDTLHTDILGGAGAGLATLLTTGHGLLSGLDPLLAIAETGISPDWIGRSL
ncbi:MAG: HAD hydrolase-like protein [Pseudomonadota bacterium]